MAASGHAWPDSGIARDTWLRAEWIALWPVGVATNVVLLALALGDERTAGHHFSTTLYVIASFLASGLLAWRRRPGRLAPLMVLLGLVWTGGNLMTLAHRPPAFTAGVWVTDGWVVLFVLALLSFPQGRPLARADRLLLAPFALAAVVLQLLWLLFWARARQSKLNVLEALQYE